MKISATRMGLAARVAIPTLIASMLTSCAEGQSYTYVLRTPLTSGRCLGAAETRMGFGKNGEGRLANDWSARLEKKAQPSTAEVVRLNWRKEAFVRQSSNETCWAAALSMAFKLQGVDRSEESFLAPLRRICPTSVLPKSASVNQVVYALTQSTTGDGVWVADRDGRLAAWSASEDRRYLQKGIANLLNLKMPNLPAPMIDLSTGQLILPGPPPPSDFLQPIEWTITNSLGEHSGGVFPIRTTDALWRAIASGVPAVIGYTSEGRSHVVLVVGVTVRVGGVRMADGTIWSGGFSESKIESVEVVDPAGDGSITVLEGDALIREVRMAFAVQL